MDTKELIVEESLRLFNDHGEQAVGVREIARKLKISPGNLSYYFPRKDEILRHHLNKLESELEILTQAYLNEEEDLYRFPELLQSCMKRQLAFRGLFNSGVGNELEVLRNQVHNSVSAMARQGHFQMNEEDAEFLVEEINFRLKFWLFGFPLESEPKEQEKHLHANLLMIVRLLSVFASPNGRINLLRFKAGILRQI